MCWEDWRIMARCRQVKTQINGIPASAGSFSLPADLRRFGIVVHGTAQVRVWAKVDPDNRVGELLWAVTTGSDAAQPFLENPLRTHSATILEIGGGIRGALYIEYDNVAIDGSGYINELQYCGPESLE